MGLGSNTSLLMNMQGADQALKKGGRIAPLPSHQRKTSLNEKALRQTIVISQNRKKSILAFHVLPYLYFNKVKLWPKRVVMPLPVFEAHVL